MATLNELFYPLVNDGRIGSRHISIFLALLQCREGAAAADEPFFIRKTKVMRLGKIRGRTTYYRVMRELKCWGYIEYWPSCRSDGKSMVVISRNINS